MLTCKRGHTQLHTFGLAWLDHFSVTGVIVMCGSPGKVCPVHVSLGICVSCTYITRDACVSSVIHVSLHTFH